MSRIVEASLTDTSAHSTIDLSVGKEGKEIHARSEGHAGNESKGRRRIAFMLASLHSGSAKKVWPELLRAAEKQQGPLFIFPGGRISSMDEFEYMRNGIFSLVNSSNFDAALSWASSLSGFVPEKEVERFLLSGVDIPLVTFGLKIGDWPVVNIDAYSGMRQLVHHLAKKHGRLRIAFIGGPQEHSSSVDRYRAYRDTLVEEGIPFNPMLECLDNAWDEGRKAALKLLDRNGMVPGKDFDALCGASDLLVFEASKLFQERGFRIPADVAIGGFNDSEESDIFPPTYTTVKMPFEREALQAFHMLLDMLDGGQPSDRMLKTRLVIRQSCGCRTERVQRAGTIQASRWKRRMGQGTKAASGITTADILIFILKTSGITHEDRPSSLEAIVSAFVEASGGHGVNVFLDALDSSLNECIFGDREIDIFQDILSSLRTAGAGMQGFRKDRQKLEAMIGQARVLVSEAEKRTRNYRAWKERTLDHWLNSLGQELLWAKSCDSILEAASRCLPNLGIGRAYLVLPSTIVGESLFAGGFDSTSGTAKMLKSPDDSKMTRFPASRLLPENMMPSGKGVYIVLPLYSESTALGYFVVQATRSDAYIYEEIRAQISSAFRGVRLFEEADAARALAEKAEKLKTEFLAGISAELQAPIDFIHSLAGRMLENGRTGSREDIEKIRSSAARQKELTQRLLDLSRAQVNDINLAEDLIDPVGLMQTFLAAKAEGKAGVKTISAAIPKTQDHVPRIRGDRERLLQILGIFTDILGQGAPNDQVEAFLSAEHEGITIGMRSPDRRTASDVLGIGMELASRIAFLHGGKATRNSDGKMLELRLHLPYPCLAEMQSGYSSDDTNQVVILSGEIPQAFEKNPYILRELNLNYFAQAGRPGAHPAPRIICLDLDAGLGTMTPALELALERSEFRRTGWYITGQLSANGHGDKSQGLRELLAAHVPVRTESTVLVFKPGSGAIQDAISLQDVSKPVGSSRISVASIEDLAVAAERYRPRVVVVSGMNSSTLKAVLANPDLANSSLIWSAERLVDADAEALLGQRPRSIVINSGALFEDAFREIEEKAMHGEESLPAATGALIVKSVFFLNRHFRESITRWRLSESVNASEDYLSRIFRRQMGISLWDYLSRLRIGFSLELLRTTGESVSEVASRAGFQDQAYFCRVFRRVTGSTPGAARKNPSSQKSTIS